MYMKQLFDIKSDPRHNAAAEIRIEGKTLDGKELVNAMNLDCVNIGQCQRTANALELTGTKVSPLC